MRLAGFLTVAGLPAVNSLLLTYILVRGLGVEGFAAWSIVEPVLRIVATIAALGMQYGVLFAAAGLKIHPRQSLGVALVVVIPMSLIAAILMWLGLRPFVAGVGFAPLALAMVSETAMLVVISSLRGQRLMSTWIVAEIVRSAGMLVAGFLLWRLMPERLTTITDFLLLRGVFTAAGFLIALMRVGAKPAFDPALARRMGAYGLPIASAGIIQMIATSADRFMLAGLGAPAAAIAIYAAHQRLTGILNVVAVTPINLWYPVEAIRRDPVKDARFFRGVMLAVEGLLATMMLVAFVAGRALWPIMFPTIGFDPLLYALLCLSVVPQILCVLANIGGLREKSTHINAIMVVVSVSVMAVTGVPLILAFLGVGAALARLAGITAQGLVGAVMSYRVVPLTHRFAPMIPFAVAMATAVAMLFQPVGSPYFWLWLAESVFCIVAGFVINRKLLGSLIGVGGQKPAKAV